MTPEIAVLGIALGLLFALICYLATNLSPGGMITPGWLALLLVEDIRRAAVLLSAVALTYALVRVLQRLVILYGKRLFATVVMVAVFLQVGFILLFLDVLPESVTLSLHAQAAETTTLGFIVPGLIAYQLLRQPVVPTFIAIATVTALTYVVMLAGILLRLFPGGTAGLQSLGESTNASVDAGELAVGVVVALVGLAALAVRSARPRRSLPPFAPWDGMPPV